MTLTPDGEAETASRYARLSRLLEQDPANPALLADTAEAAFAEQQFNAAQALLERCAELAPLPGDKVHLAGLTAMRLDQWDRAAAHFEALLAGGADAPPVRFNLAWSLAKAGQYDAALPLLDDATATALPQAAQLLIYLLHQAGMLDEAADKARSLIEIHPHHADLGASISILALDIQDHGLAERSARAAGDHPAALTTLGTLALAGNEPVAAIALFDEALRRDPDSPRARVGMGLAHLVGEDKAAAAAELDRGASLFGDHLGSWIAAGWAWFTLGDIATARARFETALALDDTFAETHGSLAAIDILEGRIEEGRRRVQIALRLDRQSFSAAFASMLLAAGGGDRETAQRIFEVAINTPLDASGRTIGQALARLAA